MSAFVVSDKHINVMVYKAAELRTWIRTVGVPTNSNIHCEYFYMNPSHMQEVANQLIKENTQSVCNRYKDHDNDVIEHFRLQKPAVNTCNLYEVYSLIQGFEYQCSESDNYDLSWTAYFCSEFKTAIITSLPEFNNNNIWTI